MRCRPRGAGDLRDSKVLKEEMVTDGSKMVLESGRTNCFGIRCVVWDSWDCKDIKAKVRSQRDSRTIPLTYTGQNVGEEN